MSELIVGGVILESFAKHQEKSGCYTRLHFKGDVSEGLKQLLKIESADLPDTVSNFPFMKDCALSANTMHLEPAAKEFKKQFTIELSADLVSDFSIARVKDKNGNGGAFLQASFNVRTRQKDACAMLECFKENLGEGVSQLRVKYSEQAGVDDGSKSEPATAREENRRKRQEEK